MQAVVGNAVYSQVMGGLGDSPRKIRHYPTRRIRNKFDMDASRRSPAPRSGLWLTGCGSSVAVRSFRRPAPSSASEVAGFQSASTAIAFRLFARKLAFRPATSDGDLIVEPVGSPVILRASNGVFLCSLASLPCQ